MEQQENTQKQWVFKFLVIALGAIAIGMAVMLLVVSAKLHTAQLTLESVQHDLATAQAELTATRTNLDSVRADLAETESALSQTRSDLATSQADLASTQASLAQTRDDLDSARASAAATSQQLSDLQTAHSALQADYDATSKELSLYKDTYGSVVASGVRPAYQHADIVNNPAAVNPTWAQLQAFLLADRTDRNAYLPGIYVCTDFARDVHNNAERAGIRAAWVGIDFLGQDVGHALNAFKTTDRGLVFIDCTGLQPGEDGPSNRDKTVSVRLGLQYTPVPLFPEGGWYWLPMGVVSDVEVYW